MAWNSSSDLLEAIHDAHHRVKTKETEVEAAHAEARLLASATRLLDITLEHARLTGRLKEGDAVMPGMKFTE